MASWLIQIGVGVTAGAILLAIRILLSSRDKQGERLGRIEKWIDVENGRRMGIAETEAKHGRKTK